jgi:rhamnosyltransferase
MTKRLGVFAHYDPQGEIKGFIAAHLTALRPLCERLVFVSTAPLTEAAKAQVAGLCDVCYQLPNVGYDFWMWRHALYLDGREAAYDEILLTNSSVFGPIGDLSATVERMSASPCDYWGINESDELKQRCFQSYFFVFKAPVIRSLPWSNFWESVKPLTDKWQVIIRYELGISVQMRKAGFRSASQVPMLPGQRRSNPTFKLTEDMLRHGCHFVKVSVMLMIGDSRRKAIMEQMAASGYNVSLVEEILPEGAR